MITGTFQSMIETADDHPDLSNSPALARSRRFSLDAIRGIGAALERTCGGDGGSILTVAAAGSLGRLEASERSDVDCVVIVDETAEVDPRRLARTIEALTREFSHFGLRAPKADGIYCKPIKASALLDQAGRGSFDEPAYVFGSRMQLLLDARPLWRAEQFVSLREQIVRWYSPPGTTGWTHLLNDLSRYLHAYAVWQQFKFSRSADDGWFLRQAKLRSTRVATFAGLMFLLGESTRSAHRQRAWLLAELDRTPLGRVQKVFGCYPDANFGAVIDIYESLHRMLSHGAVRAELVQSSPLNAAAVPANHTGAYARIHELSAALMDQLTQFILSRRDDWSSLIFRNWLL